MSDGWDIIAEEIKRCADALAYLKQIRSLLEGMASRRRIGWLTVQVTGESAEGINVDLRSRRCDMSSAYLSASSKLRDNGQGTNWRLLQVLVIAEQGRDALVEMRTWKGEGLRVWLPLEEVTDE